MNWLSTGGIAIGLAMDAFAVAIAAGLTIERLTGRHVFRVAFHFGLFQFMMPVIGWFCGRSVSGYVAACDHWVAFGLLGVIGGKMLWDAARDRGKGSRKDPSRSWSLVMLSAATSIDALAVGVSMAFLGVSIWLPSIIIGLVAGLMSLVGICLGNRLGNRTGRLAECFGGLVLIGIGIRILSVHLAGGA
ncbi:MAG: manganese efflux pump [Phycisphaerae bacterium]|nr:manganese efflux pump [Planctomycetota bacterium]MBL7219932.1 manganese efflux pump [Phycisphaerae bacterium]